MQLVSGDFTVRTSCANGAVRNVGATAISAERRSMMAGQQNEGGMGKQGSQGSQGSQQNMGQGGQQAQGQQGQGKQGAQSEYWRQQFQSEPYYQQGKQFEDYEQAYNTGEQGRSQ